MTKPAWIIEAESHLGFKEGPNNTNPFGKHYGIPNQPWCALFVSFCCEKSGRPLPSMQSGMPDGYAGVYWGMKWAQANGFWRPSWQADPGDAIVYGWNGPSSSPDEMHTGFITSSGPKGSTGHTIEGNRADQVERQSFTVGADIVLGTIAVSQILKSRRKPKPAPQPRHPHHPTNSGPGPVANGKPVHFGPIRSLVIEGITADLAAGRAPDTKAQAELVDLNKAWKGGKS